jgi:hypothetical protein
VLTLIQIHLRRKFKRPKFRPWPEFSYSEPLALAWLTGQRDMLYAKAPGVVDPTGALGCSCSFHWYHQPEDLPEAATF